MKQTFRSSLLALGAVTLMSACGGGSDGPAPATSVTATLQGKAAKGIIINGQVTANELNSDGTVKNANVGSATTDSTGRYSITTNSSYQGGPIEVVVTKDASTTMVCDAVSGCGTASDAALDSNNNGSVDFGEQYKPSTLNMSAMLPDAGDGETIDIQITPFTHMAAQRARAVAATGGSLDSTTVAQANSAISNMLGGVNILRTEPVDITDVASLTSADVTAIAYAAMAAAIAELADDDATTGEPDIEKELDDLSTEFEDGSFSADTLGTIVTNASNSLNQTGTADSSGVLATIQTEVDNAGSGGSITPQASAGAGDSNIDKAYAFISDLRTWGTVISNEVTNPSQAFETQLDLADRAAQTVQDSLGEAMGAAGDAIGQLVDGLQASGNLADYTVFGGSFSAGTIARTSPAGSAVDVITISGASFTPTASQGGQASAATIENMVVQIPRDQQEIAANSTVSYGITAITAEDASARLVATAGTLDIVLNNAFTPDFNAINMAAPSIKSLGFDLQASITEKLTLDASGSTVTAADPVTFTGELGFTVYPVQDANGEVIDGLPGTITLGGNIANTSGDSFDMSFSATLNNAATLSPTNTPLALDSTFVANNDANNDQVEDLNEHLVYWQYNGNSLAMVDNRANVFDNRSFTATWNAIDGSVSINSPLFGVFTDFGPYASITAWAGANSFQFNQFFASYYVDGQGFYQQSFSSPPIDVTANGFIAFILDEPEVNFNLDPEPAVIGLTFTAQLSGLQEARFNISGNKTALDTGNASVTISYDSRSITFSGSSAPTAAAGISSDSASITITNSDGVSLVLSGADTSNGDNDNSSVSGSLTIDGVEIASVTETSNGFTKVTYIDGTFEIF